MLCLNLFNTNTSTVLCNDLPVRNLRSHNMLIRVKGRKERRREKLLNNLGENKYEEVNLLLVGKVSYANSSSPEPL